MVPFKSFFTGEETPPYTRAVSVQKCVRAGGKHNDLDDIGRTNRHFSFFEMLGNFSFGDYFKADAIRFAWDFYTEVLDLDVDRLWVTVHEDDDEAEAIWRDGVGFPAESHPASRRAELLAHGRHRAVRSELGDLLGSRSPSSGPTAVRSPTPTATSRSGTSCSCSSTSRPTARRRDLPKPSIDTGAGLERNLMVVQGKTSIWDIDVFQPLLEQAERATGARRGTDEQTEVSLRIIAEHARTMTFMVSDGVRPSNQERGYVLRRIIRACGSRTRTCSARATVVTPSMVDAVVESMASAYPELAKHPRCRARCRRTRRGGVPRHAAARRRDARHALPATAT